MYQGKYQANTRKKSGGKTVILVILIVALLSGMAFAVWQFFGKEKTPEKPATVSTNPQTETTSSGEVLDLPDIGAIEADEGLFTVTLSLPASLFENTDDFDPESYAKENGFKAAFWNDDGSLSVTMSKSKHKELIEEMEQSIEESFQELIGGENTPYIKDITHTKEFKTVTVKVVRSEYEKAFDMTPFLIALSVMTQQAFLDMEYHTEVSIVDVDTGDVISTIVYPDALQNN